jgi:hypothetical protein
LTAHLGDSNVDDLLSVYADAATAHIRATAEGNYKAANNQHDIVAAVYRELRRRGPESQGTLLALLDHHDPGVRAWAGAHALEFSPDDGERTRTELVATGGLVAFTAEMTLETSRRGAREFPGLRRGSHQAFGGSDGRPGR